MDLSTASATPTSSNEVNENSSDVLLKRANELPKIRRNANNNAHNDDGYVLEDMNLVQQDQPYSPYHRHHPFQMQKDYSTQDSFEPKKRPQQNWQLTKEVQIKQGYLKGVVRPMHPHTGLRNVNQYLGIPYAAAPIGNGRFMPPGLCCIQTHFVCLFVYTRCIWAFAASPPIVRFDQPVWIRKIRSNGMECLYLNSILSLSVCKPTLAYWLVNMSWSPFFVVCALGQKTETHKCTSNTIFTLDWNVVQSIFSPNYFPMAPNVLNGDFVALFSDIFARYISFG